MAESDQGKRKRASNQPPPPAKSADVVPYLEHAMERRTEVALANQKAEAEAAEKREAANAEAAKTAPQDHVPPKITAANMLEAFGHHMKIARQRRLTDLARKHPEIKSAIQLSTK